MEVNDTTQAAPSLRHSNKGCNILFADFHAETIVLKTLRRPLRSPLNNILIDTWESEFIDGSGSPVDSKKQQTMEQQGISRNPNMPYFWSIPGKLYRPGFP
jgi:prepilin-type processing-associated H-X9-DG protein